MVKGRKILIIIETDIAQKEADVFIPERLADWFDDQMLYVKIIPNAGKQE